MTFLPIMRGIFVHHACLEKISFFSLAIHTTGTICCKLCTELKILFVPTFHSKSYYPKKHIFSGCRYKIYCMKYYFFIHYYISPSINTTISSNSNINQYIWLHVSAYFILSHLQAYRIQNSDM